MVQVSKPLDPCVAQAAAAAGGAASGPAADEAAACGALERGLLLFKLLGNLHAPSDALPEVKVMYSCHVAVRSVVRSASGSGLLLFKLGNRATCTILYYTILYYTILYYTILYYTILYYTILYCLYLSSQALVC